MKRTIFAILFLLGLFYILIPGVPSINQVPRIPNSTKSNLEGDTIQNPNIAAYFSDLDRAGITNYYKDFFSKSLIPNFSLPFIVINHPPEDAYQFIRDQQESVFLEEYVFPFRESLYVNGYIPKVDNDIHLPGVKTSFEGEHLYYGDKYFYSKATIRYYPSNVFARIFVYLGLWLSVILLYKLTIKVIKK